MERRKKGLGGKTGRGRREEEGRRRPAALPPRRRVTAEGEEAADHGHHWRGDPRRCCGLCRRNCSTATRISGRCCFVAVISYVVTAGEAVVVAGTITGASILRFCIIGSSSGNCGSRLKLPPNRFVDRRCSVQPFFIRSGGRIRFVYAACSCFCFREGASRAEVLIVGDFGLSKKESVNKFGLSF
ncbi:uncharacterized protein DS421_16g543800 [Arachis hypogaea]|nr:uncharacterized protein DS421_16g543800 [Arachis hypogaea]